MKFGVISYGPWSETEINTTSVDAANGGRDDGVGQAVDSSVY